MQYDFNLQANEATVLEVSGRFFKYKSGNGVVTVRTSSGGSIDLLPGQGVWNVDFTRLTVKDKSGLANAGVLLAGEYDFHDDRIVGTVEVVDGGKARTLAGNAFSGAIGCQATATNYACCQLWNPLASGKNIFISKVFMSASDAGTVTIGNSPQANSGVLNSASNKRAGGPAPSAKSCPSEIATAVPAGFLYLGQVYLSPNTPFIYQFAEPIELPPGFGLNVLHNLAGTPKLTTTFEFTEDVA